MLNILTDMRFKIIFINSINLYNLLKLYLIKIFIDYSEEESYNYTTSLLFAFRDAVVPRDLY